MEKRKVMKEDEIDWSLDVLHGNQVVENWVIVIEGPRERKSGMHIQIRHKTDVALFYELLKQWHIRDEGPDR